MKTYQVVLTKSFLVTVRAEAQEEATRVCEFYTSNIRDISTSLNRKRETFQIETIECTVNEAIDCRELEVI